MKGIIKLIDNQLVIEYISNVDFTFYGDFIPKAVKSTLPVLEEQKEFAKQYIDKEVEFVLWTGGRHVIGEPEPEHEAWIQIKDTEELYTSVKSTNFNTSKINRVEVINHYEETFTMALGRAFVFKGNDSEVEIDIQYEGKTLKVFISKKK